MKTTKQTTGRTTHLEKIELTTANYKKLKKCSNELKRDVSYIINSLLAKIDLIAVKKS